MMILNKFFPWLRKHALNVQSLPCSMTMRLTDTSPKCPNLGVNFIQHCTKLSGKHKIYELRTYTSHPKDFKEFLKLTEENFHLRTKHSKLIGYWTSEIGGLNEVVHIWEYDSYIHRTSVRQNLASDPEWLSAYISKAAPAWMKQDNVSMSLFPWSQINTPHKMGVYELQEFNMIGYIKDWEEPLKVFVDLSVDCFQNASSSLIGAWEVQFGPQNTVFVLWQHQSFDKMKEGKKLLLQETNEQILRSFYTLVGSAHCKALLSHKVSPLQ
ncbi:protein NipSnap homolog 3B-like isoform X1 [Limulus polyphemus]|uniref:Protein NipSnap homolog 3B-like isoform X1 n=2 Tax=Limulus polyphemus TaxID=6850 RepID=A0ABM1BGU5_LIMPO|nr:protein NipSnap homolog 3B-like isoform X1 [Limulus polyphemus]